jgi:hypothetical protein
MAWSIPTRLVLQPHLLDAVRSCPLAEMAWQTSGWWTLVALPGRPTIQRPADHPP